ncbi:MAG: mercuric reductase [Chitinophagaceae bacterium]|jgi:pyruvate/2-oxoglutarate dehydrogenase complex dihydrolipoamide dehydrogenase (E3) component|nr:mercuric reductase [Chitinophagaceae bacterium]
MKNYDAIIIGSGQAGTPLTFTLASKKQKVLLIEMKELGGTCLNVGCTPTKTYVASARRMWDLQHASEMGVDLEGSFKANLAAIKKRKDALLSKSLKGLHDAINNSEYIDYVSGRASFISDKVIKVNEEEYTAAQIFINVGGRAFVPKEYNNIPYLTNENILDITTLPEHLIVIGGSYIGLEFGQMFKRFGSRVTIIERGEKLISREDNEISESILEFMQKEGVEFVFNAKTIEPSVENNEVVILVNNEIKITGTNVLLAIGRAANTDTLALKNTSIKVTERGFIEVDDFCKTSVEGVFAMGDCNGRGAFTHTAYNDFQIVESYLFGNKNRKISDRIMTYGLFVDPPLGRVGLTKGEALAKGYKVLEGKRPMSKISRAKEKGETSGFMSVLVDAETELILGACVLGVGGDEIITSVLNVMISKQSYKLIKDSVVLHPTVSELIPTTLEDLIQINKS